MTRMLLNADVGEGLQTDKLLYPYLDQANIACGGHAGDEITMANAVAACKKHVVMIGAHPAYPDREHFGRQSMTLSRREITDSLMAQVQRLAVICDDAGASIQHLKPHGALYHDVLDDDEILVAVLSVMDHYSIDTLLLPCLITPPSLIETARASAVTIQFEAFADRCYREDGRLLARDINGAVFDSPDAILAQAQQLIESKSLVTHQGSELRLRAQTLCLHGDNPASVEAVNALAALLTTQD